MESDSEATAYINGRVYTINELQPWAEAFIVSSAGIFTTVGSNDEIQAIAKRDKVAVYDLRKDFVMPGIHDAHIHILFAGLSVTSNVQMAPMVSLSDVPGTLKDGCCRCSYTRVYDDWIIGDTFMIENYDRASLDEEYPDVPVLIRAGGGHNMYLNTEALRRAGFDPDGEADEAPGLFRRRPDGTLTGEVSETAMDRAAVAIPFPSISHIKRGIKTALKTAGRAGVTSIQEAGSNSVILTALKELDNKNDLKMQIATHIVHTPTYLAGEPKQTRLDLLSRATEYRTEHVHTRFLKVVLDGVPLPPLFTHGTMTAEGEPDMSKLTTPEIASIIAEYDKKGVTCKIHCTGHGSTRVTLDAIEGARRENPGGPRHEIAHCCGVLPEDYKRFKELNVTAEMSPAVFFTHPAIAAMDDVEWNFGKMVENGAMMTVGSDWDGNGAPDLLAPCAAVVADIGGGDLAVGGKRLCKMLTLNGAKAAGWGKELGSIEVGKKASFIAVDRDLSEGQFEGATVLKTWFEGEIVHEKE